MLETASPAQPLRSAFPSAATSAIDAASQAAPRSWERWPVVPFVLTLVLAGFLLFAPVKGHTHLTWTFAGISASLLIWQAILIALARTRGRSFAMAFTPIRSHYVQAIVQFSIMAYWGWFAREVYAQAPLILAQLLFLYCFEGLITWSRGRPWRIGFGPMPIVLSTNLLLWFKDDYFALQFLMLATGALAKQFITWTRDGRRTHIFNPSAFGQFLFALALIATGTTTELTWGERIAETFEVPYMLVVIFIGGLVVQSLFHVTLMTLAACAALVLLNLAYTEITGVYYFVNINISAPIFLGIHLLITDPATSPRTHLGRLAFGAMYGTAYFALFRVLDNAGVPLFWDKLLPVPILNLMVPLINRVTTRGVIGRINMAWDRTLRPSRLNLVHMACWGALFATLFGSGYIEGKHPGDSIPFWKNAVAQGLPHAGPSLIMAAGAQAEGQRSGDAYNELGLIAAEGKVEGVKQDDRRAANFFAKATELGSLDGAINVAIQYLFLGGKLEGSIDHLGLALARLEHECTANADWRCCYLLAYAYETGRGRPADPQQAAALYQRCGVDNLYAAKGLARIGLTSGGAMVDLRTIVPILNRSATRDEESCWYLGYMCATGLGLPQDLAKARTCFTKACEIGSTKACELLKLPSIPPYSHPVKLVPGWSTAFPVLPSAGSN